MHRIIDPQTEAELEAVRTLCWDYRAYLLTFPPPLVDYVRSGYSDAAYSQLMDTLQAEHSPPTGGIVLALDGDTPVGCGMFHTFSPGVAEIKRVYVIPAARGSGVGRAIMDACVDRIRNSGFTRILMDTSRLQKAAHRIYLRMGFVERGPYHEVPDEIAARMHFYGMAL